MRAHRGGPAPGTETVMTYQRWSGSSWLTHPLDRRQFLQRSASAGAALPVAMTAGGGPSAAQQKTINVASFGGIVQEHQTRLFARPFEARTGIKVNIGPNASLALAKLQNASGAPAQWDIVSLSGAEYQEAIAQKLMVPFDYSVVDP